MPPVNPSSTPTPKNAPPAPTAPAKAPGKPASTPAKPATAQPMKQPMPNPKSANTAFPAPSVAFPFLTSLDHLLPSEYEQKQRKVIYPTVMVGRFIGPMSLTEEVVKRILGWETEEEYTKRWMALNPRLKEEQCKFGDKYFIKDLAGQRVRCWNNDRNRPFTEATAKSYAQDQLTKIWAGMRGTPNDTINGESIIIGRTGLTISAQHRLVGFLWACQIIRGKNKAYWETIWPNGLTFPCTITVGVDESQETTRTIDNVRPRNLTDVVYTSDHFRDLSNRERQECSKMTDSCVDLLWKRTQVKQGEDAVKYKTHGASMDFMDRHKRIDECVRYIYDRNSKEGKVFSELKLQPGHCAALLYLMISSATDGDTYRSSAKGPRDETKIDFANEKEAKQFWDLFGNTKDTTFNPLREALRPRVGDETSDTYGGKLFPQGDENSTHAEKMAVICKAWNDFVADEPFPEEGYKLRYKIENGEDGSVLKFWLKEKQDVGGIDLGDDTVTKPAMDDKPDENTSTPTSAELEEEKQKKRDATPVNETPEEERQRREAVEANGKGTGKGKKKPAETPEEQRKRLDDIRARLKRQQEESLQSEEQPDEQTEEGQEEEPVPEDEPEAPDPDLLDAYHDGLGAPTDEGQEEEPVAVEEDEPEPEEVAVEPAPAPTPKKKIPRK